MCELKRVETGEKMLIATDGARFYLQHTGCGEGVAVSDANRNYITTIPVVDPRDWKLSQEDIDTICAAVTAIKANTWLKNNKKRLKTLRAEIREKMEAKGIEGEVLQPIQ